MNQPQPTQPPINQPPQQPNQQPSQQIPMPSVIMMRPPMQMPMTSFMQIPREYFASVVCYLKIVIILNEFYFRQRTIPY